MSDSNVIRVASHPLAVQARQLARGARERRAAGAFLIEGPRALQEAFAAEAALRWLMVAATRMAAAEIAALVEQARRRGVAVLPVQDALLARLAPTEHGPGLLAACPLPSDSDDPTAILGVPGDRLLLVIWQPVQPGNVGALIRAAAAFGAAAVIVAGGADPWNEKAVRASAGAIHRIPVARAEPATLAALLQAQRYASVAAIAHGGVAVDVVDWSGRRALWLGSEVDGLPVSVVQSMETVTLPLEGDVESLGVALAGAVLLDAARRGRRATSGGSHA